MPLTEAEQRNLQLPSKDDKKAVTANGELLAHKV